MFSMESLQIAWWVIIGLVMIIYASTSGFDYGATMIMPFMRKEDERRVVLNTVARTWDGNQTWFIFFGGALFVIWPAVYGTIFSGFYAAMLIILWSLFFRPPGFDYRSKIENMVWRRTWDVGLFISSFFPLAAFGLAIGTIMQGVPIQFDTFSLRPFYHGDFWGLINWFAIVCAIVSILMGGMHASAFLNRRTEGHMKHFFVRLHLIFSSLFLIFFTGAGFMVAFYIPGYFLIHSPNHAWLHPLSSVVTRETGGWIISYAQYPWKAYPPIIAYIGVFLSLLTIRMGKKGGTAFWCSVMAVAGTVATAGTAMFPFVVPSSIDLKESMTVFNATSAQYTLNIMLYVAVVLFALILVYKIFAYRAVWAGKKTLSTEDVEKNKHSFY